MNIVRFKNKKLMKNLKETVKEINEKYSYLTVERFSSILRSSGMFSEPQIKEYCKLIGKGALHFIYEAPLDVVKIVLEYNIDNAYKCIHFKNDEYTSKYFVKVICKKISTNEIFSCEIDLCQYDGNKQLVAIHENIDNEIIATCRMTDNITKRGDYVKIYEGDLISTHGQNYRDTDNQLIMAYLDGRYIGGDPYYKELLWTDKYGYLAPNSKKPNLDNSIISLNESSFNCKQGRFNYHKITLQENFEIIGNINTHYNLLKP